MLVESVLFTDTDPSSKINKRIIQQSKKQNLDAIVLFSLGIDHNLLLQHAIPDDCSCQSIYLAETYGIIGYDETKNRSLELMEKGRGSEYGYQGGNGGIGCLLVMYSDGVVAGSHIPEKKDDADGVSSMMVIADTSRTFRGVSERFPLHYGGIAKACNVIEGSGSDRTKKEIPYFWVGNSSRKSLVGVTTFTEQDCGGAVRNLLQKLPSDFTDEAVVPSEIGLFPCFTRGVNLYGEDDVEVNAIVDVFKKGGDLMVPHVYGMFAHGELGPKAVNDSPFASFVGPSFGNGSVECDQFSMTSILVVHS